MNGLYKYFSLYIIFVLATVFLLKTIDDVSSDNIEVQKNILLKQAQTHYFDQINTRKWNATYGGLYVKPKENQKPNKYLKDNVLKVDDKLTLIKINPAWMTRQLSEQLHNKNFHFRITSLNPINPHNKATAFEKRALEYIEQNNKVQYYEIDSNNKKFNYMGALKVEKACMPCHAKQGYKIGDIRGGISVSLDSSGYEKLVLDIKQRAIVVKSLGMFFLLSLLILILNQFRSNEKLRKEVKKQTKEIASTKQLLQKTLDADLSMLLLRDDNGLIFMNKTLLDFIGFNTQEEFNKEHDCICDFFEDTDRDDFLTTYINGVYWFDYLKLEQDNKELKVLIKKSGVYKYLSVGLKIIKTDEKDLALIIFNDITHNYVKMQNLKEQADTDTLTKLFNRNKFNEVLQDEIKLATSAKEPLSILFIDIDFFKNVNDKYGHDAGDRVLVEIAKILQSSLRTNDFVARWGGEEFVVVLQSTYVNQAVDIANKIRGKVKKYQFSDIGSLSISLGVTQFIESDSIDTFIKRADKALYNAKENGRDRVEVL
jgi:diguanylate cyclase (GGDEF)-like protein